MNDALAIELRGLRKEFRRGALVTRAVDGLDLDVRRGEVFGLLGPNGAGKTTTVEICEGLQTPTAGEVLVLGRRYSVRAEALELRRRIGVSLQETRFFEKSTVREILELFRSFYPAGRSVAEAIAIVALEEKADTRSVHLSGGQLQRLAVATALVSTPELLFLDEPTTGLDPQSRRQLWEVVREFRAGGGTVLLTTHYMEEAEQLCDRVAIIDHGRRIALGTPRDLVASIEGAHVVEVVAAGLDRLGAARLAGLPAVTKVSGGDGAFALTVSLPHVAMPALLDLLQRERVELTGLKTRHTSLEDVFVNLTGRHLRDEGTT
ncbi:MAG: ABC transporter ATP-binding protein [Planctomycetes bacterium]|nr:ABC transporter ATP-binding protein [Planctomycetota bacterium]